MLYFSVIQPIGCKVYLLVNGLRDCPKNEYLAERRSFEGKYEILRTISQPRTLSASIPAIAKAGADLMTTGRD